MDHRRLDRHGPAFSVITDRDHCVLNLVELRSFRAVMETRHVTEAARRLGLRQSTVSQHLARLEAAIGRPLLLRDTHRVVATADGETLLGFAATILDAEARASDWLAGTVRRARLRFGVSEDLAMGPLAPMLGAFRARHPAIDLDLTVGLSGPLRRLLDAGQLDLAFTKALPAGRRSGRSGVEPRSRGRVVWRERPIWITGERAAVAPDRPVPLVVFDDGASLTRALAIGLLERAGRSWHLACTSGDLTGLLAAVRAGLGVSLQSRSVLGPGIAEAPASGALPEAPPFDYVVLGRADRLHGPALLLANAIRRRAEWDSPG